MKLRKRLRKVGWALDEAATAALGPALVLLLMLTVFLVVSYYDGKVWPWG